MSERLTSEELNRVRLVSTDELAKILSVGRSTIYRMKDKGVIPPPLDIIPGRPRWRLTDIEALIASPANDDEA